MSHQTFDDQLNNLLDDYEKGQEGKRDNRENALNEEAQFMATFVEVRANELRPAMEKLGAKLRARDHDYSVTEGDFRPPHGARAEPDEAFIKMTIYLSPTSRTARAPKLRRFRTSASSATTAPGRSASASATTPRPAAR